MLNAFDKLTANLKIKFYRYTALADVMDFHLVTILDNGKRSLINVEILNEAETTLRLHAIQKYPLSNLCGEPIQHVECDLGESRHVNIVGLAKVNQGLFGAKEEITLRIKLAVLIFSCFHDLRFKNLLIVHLSKYIGSACPKSFKVGDAKIYLIAANFFQERLEKF